MTTFHTQPREDAMDETQLTDAQSRVASQTFGQAFQEASTQDDPPQEPRNTAQEPPAAPDVNGAAAQEHQAPTAPEGEPDYKALYARELQRRRSLEGRYRKERERRQAQSRPEEASPTPAAAFASPADASAAFADEPAASPLAVENHVSTLSAAHPDWRQIADSPELAAWIDTAPAYLADGYRRVAESGTAAEVIDLLARFKADQRSPSAPDPHAARRSRTVELATAVPSRPAGPPPGRPDRQDFRSAWAEAARAERP